MKQGHAPLVTSGTCVGQPYEVDHVIPVDEFPELGNELANLSIPRTLNRRKSDENKQLSLDLGQRLSAAGVIQKDDPTRRHKLQQFGDNDTSASRKVNLDCAAASTFEKLPGIGPKTAAAILAAHTPDLDKLPGFE